jgi:hypothetical protein
MSMGNFAGGQRLTVGFMQTVMELLSVPGDIVLDWRVGEGTSFQAGEFSNRFVVGLEGRQEFKELAVWALELVVSKEIPIDAMDLVMDQASILPSAGTTSVREGQGSGSQRPAVEPHSGWDQFGDE